jgi:SAM-dependent methyltransferase
MEIDFERERAWWDAEAEKEERDLSDEFINRALRWREIERELPGVQTILDVGGGTGVFSVPLAQRGFSVTHVDFSPVMLEIAKRKAASLSSWACVEANAVDLPFPDRSFDLVLNMDGAVSFCGSAAEQAIRESCRVAARTVILTVSNRALLAGLGVATSVQLTGRVISGALALFNTGEWHQDQFPDNYLLSKGLTQDYMGALKAFTPEELTGALRQAGMRPVRVGGLGSLAQACDGQVLECLRMDGSLFETFLDLCERFDREILPDGPGTRQRAGLIAVAKRDDTQGGKAG